MMRPLATGVFVVLACAGCAAPHMRATVLQPLSPAAEAELWEAPDDLAGRNLFDGPWGGALAPSPTAPFTFVSVKTTGVSPGYTVTDEHGVEWSVKQGAEAKSEVVASRILSALGYHQPPVYYLPAWTLIGGPKPGLQSEARFRPKHTVLDTVGEWSWHENPFVGTRPFDGLRVLMMILNESDLKDSNNTLYERREPGAAPRRWYVVRDIGAALGETGRIYPGRNNVDLFEDGRFITGVKDGAVVFDYHGRHQELADHISPEDVGWMCDLLGRLSTEQWHDLFRAGGYDPSTAARFISKIRAKMAEGQALTP